MVSHYQAVAESFDPGSLTFLPIEMSEFGRQWFRISRVTFARMRFRGRGP